MHKSVSHLIVDATTQGGSHAQDRPQPRPRPRHRLRRDLPQSRHLRVPLGHEPGTELRPLPHLRSAEHRTAARRDRRVHRTRAEALRRHRLTPGSTSTGGDFESTGQGGHSPHQPDAQDVRHHQRRHALRPGHIRRRPQTVDRRLRVASDDLRGSARVGALLPLARKAHGDHRHPRDLRGLHTPARRVRGSALRLRRRGPPRRGLHHAPDDDFLPETGGSPDRHLQPLGDGRPFVAGVSLSQAECVGAQALRRRTPGTRPGRRSAALSAHTPPGPGHASNPQLPQRLRGRQARHLRPRCPVHRTTDVVEQVSAG